MLDVQPGDTTTLDDAPEQAPASGGPRLAELPVRLQVVLPAIDLPVASLAALAPGAVTALPIEGDDIRVELVAAGTRIAVGRLISLGSAYGVLIDAVCGV